MPESESFDAFYARTVWSVTSQMHELAGDDGMADHAIREAYARAYQQWYQVAGYHDSEGWVLATARDAYERRRAGAATAGPDPAQRASDSGTWPGIYRPAAKPGAAGQAAAPDDGPDPEATVAPQAGGPQLGGQQIGVPQAGAPQAGAPQADEQRAAAAQRGRGFGRVAKAAGLLSGALGSRARRDAASLAANGASPQAADDSTVAGRAPGQGPDAADWFSRGDAAGSASPPAGWAGSSQGDIPAGLSAGSRAEAANWADPAGYGAAGASFAGGPNATARISGGSGDPAFADPYGGAYAGSTAQPGPGGFGPGGAGGRGGPSGGGRSFVLPGSRRTRIVAGIAVAALVVAGIAYFAVGSGPAKTAAQQGSTAKPAGKSGPHMLAAGKTGPRSAVPWSLIGPGWAIAELSTAAPAANGNATGGGTYTTYLIDPEGGKYQITSAAGGSAPALLAWSGDARSALFGSNLASEQPSYSLLNVASGQTAPLGLPAGVVAIGLSRPDGLAILAVDERHAKFELQRYSLTGGFEATIARMARPRSEFWPGNGCTAAACALSSPDGDFDIWGISGHDMQLVSNAGGRARKLHVPAGGGSSSCVPLTWWDNFTVLADCAVPGSPDAQRLWLVPVAGGTPRALTPVSGSASGDGVVSGAWRADGSVYLATTSSRQCSGAPSGPGGLGIQPASEAGSSSWISVPGSTGNFSTVVAASGRRLLVLTQTACPGTSALKWLNPRTGAETTVLGPPANQVGVIAAVPYGNGPAAVTNGQYTASQ